MKERWIVGVAAALLAVAWVAQAGTGTDRSVFAATLDQAQSRVEKAQQKLEAEIARLQARLEQKMAKLARQGAELEARLAKEHSVLQAEEQAKRAEELAAQHAEHAERMARELAEQAVVAGEPQFAWVSDEDGSGWLGVSIEEVTAEKAKELKLPAERGVHLSEVTADSPAAKAGLKAGDVVTEFNGQRLEGTAQFRRMVRETPAGRTVQLTVWRDGRAQQLSVQLGSMEEQIRGRIEDRFRILSPDFNFKFDMPKMDLMVGRTPLLGIQADDISGQLGTYFGAPEGEGILVREVNSGSPAEKAGLKAGDVIVKVDGERVKSTSEMRSKLRERREKKTVSLGVLRNRSEMSLNVEIEQPKPREPLRGKVISRRIAI